MHLHSIYFGEYLKNICTSIMYEILVIFKRRKQMSDYIERLKKFLSDEQELLSDLALDVANAEASSYAYHKAKSQYEVQVARVEAIQEALDIAAAVTK
jgi:hypothetical protein